mmetsp:Transcript_29930/g.41429  ORF Transcript_29930/g.41429 Transcript_29930/m.41429 type:complete len:219 (-) Transcript_29930:134-790(-)
MCLPASCNNLPHATAKDLASNPFKSLGMPRSPNAKPGARPRGTIVWFVSKVGTFPLHCLSTVSLTKPLLVGTPNCCFSFTCRKTFCAMARHTSHCTSSAAKWKALLELKGACFPGLLTWPLTRPSGLLGGSSDRPDMRWVPSAVFCLSPVFWKWIFCLSGWPWRRMGLWIWAASQTPSLSPPLPMRSRVSRAGGCGHTGPSKEEQPKLGGRSCLNLRR